MEEQIQQIKDSLKQLLQLWVQMGRPFSDEIKLALAQVLEHAAQRISELRSEDTTGGLSPEPTHPPLDPGPYPSSNVNSFKYDPSNGRLFVKFHGEDSADSGPVYQYEGVPRNIYDVFAAGRVGPKTSGQNQYHRWVKGVTPSLGASLNALIKNGGYQYQRVS